MRLALFLLAVLASAARAQPDEARRKYDAGDFTGAATAFARQAADNPANPAWHYDLGNALFKAGRLGGAIASYERAFRLAPRDGDVRFNLDFALKRAGEELVPPGLPPLAFKAFHLLSAAELAGLHWLACWAALLLACLLLRRPRLREDLGPYAAAALALWLGSGAWWAGRRLLEPSRLGVITRPTAEIRSGPGESFGVSFTAPEGRRVEIISDGGGWLEIGVLKEGAKGWIAAAAVEEI